MGREQKYPNDKWVRISSASMSQNEGAILPNVSLTSEAEAK
jgi:hypothetical protein